jgi:trans-aconitate methyltransferase
MTATVLQARRSADLYIATGTPVAAEMVISICDQLDKANESVNALMLALETERDAANLYAKQVAHWIEKHDKLLEQQLETVPQKWNDENVAAWCLARGIDAARKGKV